MLPSFLGRDVLEVNGVDDGTFLIRKPFLYELPFFGVRIVRCDDLQDFESSLVEQDLTFEMHFRKRSLILQQGFNLSLVHLFGLLGFRKLTNAFVLLVKLGTPLDPRLVSCKSHFLLSGKFEK